MGHLLKARSPRARGVRKGREGLTVQDCAMRAIRGGGFCAGDGARGEKRDDSVRGQYLVRTRDLTRFLYSK